jgi:hypothetical protein
MGPGGGPPGMEMGAPGGGAPASSGEAPCGVDPAADLSKAVKSIDMADVFMGIEAYDLALAAYRDALKYEPEAQARAKQGIAKASAALKSARVIRSKMPAPPKRVAQMGGGMPGMGGDPGMMGMAPGMEGGMMGGPPALPAMGVGSGYQLSGPAVPPTAMGF